MDKFNRAREREILFQLAEVYPKPINEQLGKKDGFFSNPGYEAELCYLAGHGLVDIEYHQYIIVADKQLDWAMITSQGIDFIKDDGGIAAILGTITIKIHGDSIKEIIIKKIESSDLDQTYKQKLISRLQLLPVDSIIPLTTTLVSSAACNLPELIQTLQKYFGL